MSSECANIIISVASVFVAIVTLIATVVIGNEQRRNAMIYADATKFILKYSSPKYDAEIYLSVTDNGMGMRHEDVENILKDNQKGPKHGSGVGLINVHTRIQLMFGNKYGLIVESEPDEGTTVTIHLPAVPYTKENCEVLETPGKPVRKEGES